MQAEEVHLRIIGWVKNGIQKEISKHQWSEAISQIVIEPEFVKDVTGLELYGYIVVIFWMHRAGPVGPVGSLATCFPERPNPMGVTIVRLVERNENVLIVKGLDAFDGTPVLDLKPYKPWSFKRLKEKLPDINLERLEGGD